MWQPVAQGNSPLSALWWGTQETEMDDCQAFWLLCSMTQVMGGGEDLCLYKAKPRLDIS